MLVATEPEQPPILSSRQIRKPRTFRLENARSPDVPLAVVSGGHEYCSPRDTTHSPRVPHYSVEFIARGRGSLSLGDRRFSLAAGTVFSYGPGISHCITTDARDPL